MKAHILIGPVRNHEQPLDLILPEPGEDPEQFSRLPEALSLQLGTPARTTFWEGGQENVLFLPVETQLTI